MARTAADFLLAQEVKVPRGYPRQAAEQAARGNKWGLSIEPCSVAKGGGRSAGTAVAARSFIGLATLKAAAATQHLHAAGRFTTRGAAAMGSGGIHFGSVYLFSQVGVTAKCNLDLLESVGLTLASLVGPWMIGGYWNCTPADLQATGWLKKVGGVICAPYS